MSGSNDKKTSPGEGKHGWVKSPLSRAQYAVNVNMMLDWHRDACEGDKNFPDIMGGPAHDFPESDYKSEAPPPDGLILSGGMSDARICLNFTDAELVQKLKEKDENTTVQGWPRINVKGEKELAVNWGYSADHVTRGYRCFITKDNWNENHRITRDDFKGKNYVKDDNHFTEHSNDGLLWSQISTLSPFSEHREELAPVTTMSITLPDDKHGHHVLLILWIVAETSKAFYQVIDVDFDQ